MVRKKKSINCWKKPNWKSRRKIKRESMILRRKEKMLTEKWRGSSKMLRTLLRKLRKMYKIRKGANKNTKNKACLRSM